MKRFLLLSILIIAAFSLILSGCSSSSSSTPAPAVTSPLAQTSTAPPTSSAPVIKLKFGDQNPDIGWEGTHASGPWLADITKATNGRVQFDTYYNQSLFKGADSWTAVKNHTADLAWMFHGFWANMTPLADVLSLPMMPIKSAKQGSGIFWQLYQKYPTMAADFKDLHVLTTFTSQPYLLITSKKQVKVLADWAGLKIRTTAGPPVDMMKAMGAVPVSMGMADTYLSLQKGDIDGMLVPWEALLSYKQYEQVQYYTYAPIVSVYFTMAMNNDTWNSLPKDVQDQINSVCGLKGSLFLGENQFDTAASIGHDQVKAQGVKMTEYTVPDDEFAKWTALSQPIWNAWVKSMTDAGHPEAKDILNDCLNLTKTYNP
jgi:TRAP-type transport system periplasmic protein